MAGHHKTLHIAQGEFITAKGAEASISTILGSCVATCLYDEGGQVGGMNHFLLPDGAGASLNSARFGVNAMELLINGLLKLGANRRRLRAHVFGGAQMMAGLGNIGARNAVFSADFLRAEGMRIMTCSTGGTQARRVNFWPATGRAKEELIGHRIVETPPASGPGGEVELF